MVFFISVSSIMIVVAMVPVSNIDPILAWCSLDQEADKYAGTASLLVETRLIFSLSTVLERSLLVLSHAERGLTVRATNLLQPN